MYCIATTYNSNGLQVHDKAVLARLNQTLQLEQWKASEFGAGL